MNDRPVIIKLTRDQALVLSDWLEHAMVTSDRLNSIVSDRAVWSPLQAISGALETTLPEIFSPDYGVRLAAARSRLIESLGEFGADVIEDQ